MELNWSRWFRCESSFGLLLVPDQPGIFALAEELVAPDGGLHARRMLAVFEIDEAEEIARSLSWLFLPSSPWRSRLLESRCYVRYAVVADAQERKALALTLKNWLVSQMDLASQIFDYSRPQQRLCPDESMQLYRSMSEKTVAERAVDKVTGINSY
ncbi:MAG TPA: hypothetical protein VHA33_01055 [Candidatus Angelobacter sp.]|jgi:hypothetical protein|nr:hypothetical protein [Candidatus Angelobacter sp.]